MQKYSRFVLQHPWLVVTACLLLAIICAAGLGRFTFTTDYRVFFGPENPDLAAFEDMEEQFTRNETALFVLEAEDGQVFKPDTLKAIRAIEEGARNLPYVTAVYSLNNYYQVTANGDDILVEPLVPDVPIEQINIEAIKAEAMGSDRLRNGLLSDAGDVTGIVAYFSLPHKNPEKEMADVALTARDIAKRVEADFPGHTIRLSGMVMFNHALSEASNWDRDNLFPLAYLMMFVLLAIFFRGFSSMSATVVVILLSVLTGLGLGCWLGIGFTSVSMASVLIIMTLAIADCVHLLASFDHERHQGYDRRTAMTEALRINIQPIFLTSLTTALGFASMNFSESPPYRDLGNVVILGVFAAFLFSISFVPAFMMLIPLGKAKRQLYLSKLMGSFANFVIRYRNALLIGMGGVMALCAACIPMNEFGDNYIKFFADNIEFRRHAEFTNDRLTGMQLIEYPVDAGGEGDVNDPEYLRHLQNFVDWYKAQPETKKVSSILDLMKDINQAMHGDDPAYYRLPETREEAAQYLFLFELSLPQGVDLTFLVNMDKSASRLSIQLDTITSEEIVALDQRAQDWQRENWPEAMFTPGSGVSVLFAKIARRGFDSMVVGTLLALTGISLILVFAFRSKRLGLISLVPNLAPILMGFGIWGLLSGVIGMGLSVVAALTMGIVVDDTVHILSKYRRARVEKGLSAEDAVRYAFANVGVALWITSIALIAGFLLVATSSFTLNADMGLLTAIVIACALAADFLFLPPLLMLIDNKDRKLGK